MKTNRIMNKIKFYSCLLTAASLMVACEDLPDEQFTKYANFTRSDYQEWVMEYDPSGEVTSDVSISISGTSVLSKDLKVEVELNTAKLDSFNFEKFRNETALYYEVLPEDCYEIADYGTTIKAGDEFGLMPVKFHLDKINKYKNYVLPLSIFRVSANSIALSPYYFTLMNIVLKNNFSGLYSSSLKCYSPDDKSTIEVKEN